MSITLKQFQSLKHGDIVHWKTKAGGYDRTVLVGPGDYADKDPMPTHNSVMFPIRHRSWTGRVDTIYNYCDVCHKITPTGRVQKNLVGWHEVSKLIDIGFNPVSGMARMVRDEIDRNKRRTRGSMLCSVGWQNQIGRTIRKLRTVITK